MADRRDLPIKVTDHAVLRYLERVQGFNIEAVREHISKVCAGPAAAGAMTLRAEGVRFTFSRDRKTVTTVMPDDGTLPCRTTIQRLGARE